MPARVPDARRRVFAADRCPSGVSVSGIYRARTVPLPMPTGTKLEAVNACLSQKGLSFSALYNALNSTGVSGGGVRPGRVQGSASHALTACPESPWSSRRNEHFPPPFWQRVLKKLLENTLRSRTSGSRMLGD